MTTRFPTIYKRSQTGAVQEWTIVAQDNTFYTEAGQVGGVITTSTPTVCLGKNPGKANETSGNEQAYREAKAKRVKKLEEGYFENIADIDNIRFEEPMLAQKYKEYLAKGNELDFNDGIYVSYKYDGTRCLVSQDKIVSRNNKPYSSIPHIHDAFVQVFQEYPNIELDGELYNHNYKEDFNTIISLVKKSKPKLEDIMATRDKIQYHVYDYRFMDSPGKDNFETRHQFLKDLFSKYLSYAGCPIIHGESLRVKDQTDMDSHYGLCSELGYEGQMVRLNRAYENKRTWSLLKRKEFIDEECEIIEILEGKGGRSGMMGMIRCLYKTKDGIIKKFKAGARGNNAFRIAMFNNKEFFVGLMATIRYQTLTPEKGVIDPLDSAHADVLDVLDGNPGGVPRFGVMIQIRDKDGNDIPINIDSSNSNSLPSSANTNLAQPVVVQQPLDFFGEIESNRKSTPVSKPVVTPNKASLFFDDF